MSEPVEVRRVTPAYRVLVITLWLAGSAFFYWAAYTHRNPNVTLNYVFAGLMLYGAAYWARFPGVLARADEAGITYVDFRYGLLLVFGEARAPWSSVVGVDTRELTSRYGAFLSTRVTLRGEGEVGTRHFTVSSRARGYVAFLDAVRAHTQHATIARQGLGDDAARAGVRVRDLARSRTKRLAIVLTIIAAMLAVILALQKR